jgi:hypothetical protein
MGCDHAGVLLCGLALIGSSGLGPSSSLNIWAVASSAAALRRLVMALSAASWAQAGGSTKSAGLVDQFPGSFSRNAPTDERVFKANEIGFRHLRA